MAWPFFKSTWSTFLSRDPGSIFLPQGTCLRISSAWMSFTRLSENCQPIIEDPVPSVPSVPYIKDCSVEICLSCSAVNFWGAKTLRFPSRFSALFRYLLGGNGLDVLHPVTLAPFQSPWLPPISLFQNNVCGRACLYRAVGHTEMREEFCWPVTEDSCPSLFSENSADYTFSGLFSRKNEEQNSVYISS